MTVQEFNHVQLNQLKGNLYYSLTNMTDIITQ